VRLDVLRRGRPGGILHLAHGMLEFMLRREHAEQMRVSDEPEDRGGGA
jgi:ferrous iron transport protein A